MAYTPFRGRIPADRHYCPIHDMWVKEDAGELLIGASSFGLFLAGELFAFTAKPNGAEVRKGRGMATIESRKTVLAVHAPVSFILLASNEQAEARPALLNSDPYAQGWMVRARPLDWVTEQRTLLDAAAYRQHILNIEPEAFFED
jgi:glycine cleavage system H protein